MGGAAAVVRILLDKFRASPQQVIYPEGTGMGPENLAESVGTVWTDVHNVVQTYQMKRRGYRDLVVFLVMFLSFAATVYCQRGLATIVDAEGPLRSALNLPEESLVDKSGVYEWFNETLLSTWENPICGDKSCNAPYEYAAFWNFGCMADCGGVADQMSAIFEFTTEKTLWSANIKAAENDLWNLCFKPFSGYGDGITTMCLTNETGLSFGFDEFNTIVTSDGKELVWARHHVYLTDLEFELKTHAAVTVNVTAIGVDVDDPEDYEDGRDLPENSTQIFYADRCDGDSSRRLSGESYAEVAYDWTGEVVRRLDDSSSIIINTDLDRERVVSIDMYMIPFANAAVDKADEAAGARGLWAMAVQQALLRQSGFLDTEEATNALFANTTILITSARSEQYEQNPVVRFDFTLNLYDIQDYLDTKYSFASSYDLRNDTYVRHGIVNEFNSAANSTDFVETIAAYVQNYNGSNFDTDDKSDAATFFTGDFGSCVGGLFETYTADGYCDPEMNTDACGWDGGDCCEQTCVSGSPFTCGVNGYNCVNPTGDCDFATALGNGVCNLEANIDECSWDGGDCCASTCNHADCATATFTCTDPDAVDTLNCDYEGYKNDGYCDHPTSNTFACSWDGGDCCPSTCDPSAGACQNNDATTCYDESIAPYNGFVIHGGDASSPTDCAGFESPTMPGTTCEFIGSADECMIAAKANHFVDQNAYEVDYTINDGSQPEGCFSGDVGGTSGVYFNQANSGLGNVAGQDTMCYCPVATLTTRRRLGEDLIAMARPNEDHLHLAAQPQGGVSRRLQPADTFMNASKWTPLTYDNLTYELGDFVTEETSDLLPADWAAFFTDVIDNYDMHDCTTASGGNCTEGDLYVNNICDQACNIKECAYDFGNCKSSAMYVVGDDCADMDYFLPADGCYVYMAADNICDPVCLSDSCSMDAGACCTEVAASLSSPASYFFRAETPSVRYPFPDPATPLMRTVARNNVIIQGVLATATVKEAEECATATQDGNWAARLKGSGYWSDEVPETRFDELYGVECIGDETSTKPRGYDPIFVSGSYLYSKYNNDAFSVEEYYEESGTAIDVNSNLPFGFNYTEARSGSSTFSGYHAFFDINFYEDWAKDIELYLEEGDFISDNTVEVRFSYVTFNAQLKVFAENEAIFTFEESGEISTEGSAVDAFRIQIFDDNIDYLRYVFEIVQMICVSVQWLVEFWEMYQNGIGYIWTGEGVDFWNLVDLGNLGLFTYTIFYIQLEYYPKIEEFYPALRIPVYGRINRETLVGGNWLAHDKEHLLDVIEDLEKANYFSDFWRQYMFFSGVCFLLMILRLLKQLHFQPTLGVVTRTLKASGEALASWTVVFVMVWFAFAFMGFLMFGNWIKELSTFLFALDSTFNMLTFVWIPELQNEEKMPFLLSLWTYSYLIITFFVLMNVLLAILVESYLDVRKEAQRDQSPFEDVRQLVRNEWHDAKAAKTGGKVMTLRKLTKLTATYTQHQTKDDDDEVRLVGLGDGELFLSEAQLAIVLSLELDDIFQHSDRMTKRARDELALSAAKYIIAAFGEDSEVQGRKFKQDFAQALEIIPDGIKEDRFAKTPVVQRILDKATKARFVRRGRSGAELSYVTVLKPKPAGGGAVDVEVGPGSTATAMADGVRHT
uniref:LNR domain-containing protein n=1 Tax=Phaeomonas parva TaxID=124430 RepID=A0A7S1TZS8_9STRA